VSLIPELAVNIGADRAEGVALRLQFVDGGGVAIREILNGNSQFGVFGATAAMKENLGAQRLVALASIEDLVPLSVVVRSDLRDSVRRIEDLRGRVIGIHSNSLATMTNGQQFVILLLRQHGVAPEDARFIAAGQSWETQSSALRSKLVDAVVSEEPISMRLEREGIAFPLFRSGQPDDPDALPGSGFLRGALITHRKFVDAQPQLVERVVRVMQRTLEWRAQHRPEEVASALGIRGPEAQDVVAMLKRYPRQYSDDGKFSESQIRRTDTFFRESAGNSAEATRYRLDSMVIDRWAGRKP